MYQMALRSFTMDGTLLSAAGLLPFIKDCGFDAVYLCPVFSADDDPDEASLSERQKASGCGNPKNPYKMKDYYTVDEEYGTNEDLKTFIDTAHSLGLKVLLDLVYLHCGKNAVFISEHPDWVEQDENGKPLVGERWPFARINYRNDGVREYLWNNMTMFIKDYGADGFRCDVGDSVPLDFWREGKRRIKAINPDIILLNEGRDPEYVREVFDLNYFNNLGGHLSEMLESKNITEYLAEKLKYLRKTGIMGKCINYIENHDTASDTGENRIERSLGHDKTSALIVLIYTWLGIPLIFNGNEIADSAEQCMFSNRFFGKRAGIDWSNLLRKEGAERLELVKKLNSLRKTHSSFSSDETELLPSSENLAAAYIKSAGEERILVCLNFSDNTVSFPYKGETMLSRNAETTEQGITIKNCGFAVIKL